MQNHYNREAAAKAQEDFTNEHHCPMFAPKSGWCYHCGQNIYDPVKTKSGVVFGYSVEYCETRLITNCPFCRHGFTN